MKRIALLLAVVCVCQMADAAVWPSNRCGAALADGALEGVDAVGHAVAEYALGTLPAGEHPVFAYWSSEDWCGATTLGYGWRIPLFESRIFLDAADCLVMYDPDGVRARFWRTNEKEPNVFRGRYGSGCIEKGGVIRYYRTLKDKKSPDLVFKNGRLVTMRCDDGKTLEIRYSAGGSFEQLTCGGKVWCRMDGDDRDDRMRRVAFANGDQAEILLGTVRVAASGPGGRIRLAERRSVIQMKIGGRTYRFAYGLAKDGRAMFSDGDRNYSYDPKSRQLLTLNDWTYAITEIDTKRRNAHFLRKRPDGETEEDYANEETGMRIRERKGCRHVWRVFTSGKNLRGRRRWAEEFYPQGYGSRIEYTYDEKGALVMTRRTDRKSGEITEVRFAKTGRANYSKITQKTGDFIEYWLDVKDGKLLRTMKNGNKRSVCDYLYAPSGERVASVQNGKIVNRFVPNADEFVKWHEDMKKGAKKPAPRIKTQEEVKRENARNTNFIVFWTHPDAAAFDLTGLKAADTPRKMSLALEKFYEGLYLRPGSRYGLDIVGPSGRTHHLEIDSIQERGVDLEPGIWRVVQPNVQLMEFSPDDWRYRILSDGRFKKGTNDLHFAAVLFPKSAMVTVAGRVVDGRGKPLRGALVKGRFLPMLDYVTYPEIRAMTDDAGRYRFENVPPVRIPSIMSYVACGDFGEMRTGGLYEGANTLSIETQESVRVEVRLISERDVRPIAETVALLRSKWDLLDKRTQRLIGKDSRPTLPKSEDNVIFVPDLIVRK